MCLNVGRLGSKVAVRLVSLEVRCLFLSEKNKKVFFGHSKVSVQFAREISEILLVLFFFYNLIDLFLIN